MVNKTGFAIQYFNECHGFFHFIEKIRGTFFLTSHIINTIEILIKVSDLLFDITLYNSL